MAEGAQPPIAGNVAQLLETLHPLREPPPPAPVLPYLAMLALGIAVAAGAVALLRLRRRRGLRASALVMLAESRALGPSERLAAQAALLRRLVRACGGDARAEGADWLAALDRTFATRFFTAGEGRAFADGLYRRAPAADPEALDRALAGLIGKAGWRAGTGWGARAERRPARASMEAGAR